MDTRERVVAGRYRLLTPLGSGGMGTVWRAEDTVLGRDVAVKEVTFPHGLSDEDRDVLRERTRREARAAARLDHPSAVTVYDVVEEAGSPYLVMELVEARTLSQVVRADGPLSPRQTARVGLALLGALEAAHAQGIVHRDVKPGNVLLCELDGPLERIVLTDFGIASSPGDSSITSTGLLLGSPSYIAPERARGQAPAAASDLWSLGATLFTAVEGKPPFDGGEPLLTVTAVVTGEQEPYDRAGPLVPALDGLLQRDPARRMSAPAARRELERVSAAAPEDNPPTVAVPAPAAAAAQAADRTAALPVREMREAAGTSVRPSPADPGWTRPPRIAPRRRRSPLPLVLGLALLLAAGVVGLVLATDPGRGPLTALTPGGDEPSASGQASPSPEDGSAAEPAPEGWQSFTREPGYTVHVPPSYAQSTFDGRPQYKDQETGRTLRVATTGPGGGRADTVADRRQQAQAFAATHDNYREITISEVEYRDYETADWEFTYTDGGADLHALSRVFVVDGRGYSLFFQTRASDDWDAALEDFQQIAASFSPA